MQEINHEYYVSPEIAKLLKEAGFDWKVMSFYTNDISDGCESEYELRLVKFDNWNGKNKTWCDLVSAPTLEVAQRWLREVKKCYVSVVADCDSVGVFYFIRIIYYDTNNNYYATYVWDETNLEHVKHWKIFNNFKEAFEAGIKKALEIILEKGE